MPEDAPSACKLFDPLRLIEVAIVNESVIPVGLCFKKILTSFASDAVQSDSFAAKYGAESYHLRGIQCH